MVMPGGVGKFGSCGLPSVSTTLQRLAISTAFWSAPGMSANSSAISAWVLKRISSLKRLTRLPLASISPSAMQVRASWAMNSSLDRNWIGWVATTGRPSLAASATAWRTWASWLGWPARWISM